MKEKKLVNAHIIPSFMYAGMKEAEGAFYKIKYDLGENSKKTNKIQTGEFDKNILCEDCDNRILGGIYEDYAVQSMYGKELVAELVPICTHHKDPESNIEYSICKNIDYKKMKLFMLSLLWRSSITSRPLFKEINLSEIHEERIRSILLNGEEIDELEYPILISSYYRADNNFKNLIVQPKTVITENEQEAFLFLIDGIQYLFFTPNSKSDVSDSLKAATINKERLLIIHKKKDGDTDFLKMYMNK